MATIPLPALNVPQAEAPDILGQFAKVMAIRNQLAQQQYNQQMQPLQLQEQQLATQKAQQGIADQHATTQAMLSWDGKDPTTLYKSVLNNNGSGDAALALQQHFLDIRDKTATAVKNEGEGALAQANAQKIQYDQRAGQLNAITALPDEQVGPALLSTANQWAQNGWIDPQHLQAAQAIAQMPAPQARQQLKLLSNSYLGATEQIDAGLKAAQTGEAQARTVTIQQQGQLGQLQADARNQWLAANPDKNINDYTAVIAGQEQAAKEAGAFPYQARLAAIREQANNSFWNNKDAMTEVENKYLQPYQQKMAAVNELKVASQQAQAGNVASARGVVLKLMGVANPDGTKRYNEAEAQNMMKMGGVPDRFQGTMQNLLTGNQWTPQMAADINSFADAQGQVAQTSLNAGIDSINTLHGTKIGQGLKAGGAGSGIGGAGGANASAPTVAPEGTVVVRGNGQKLVKRGGQWQPLQ